ncbi:MAG: GAF domain-containing protein [Magnetococcales bacterium]|nr:GAF domain-containing protein [Magnetococcales bacterium]
MQLDKRVFELRLYSDMLLTFHTAEERRKLEHQLQHTWNELNKHLAIILDRFLGDMDQVIETQTLLETWWHLLQREIVLIQEQRNQEVITQRATPEYQGRIEQINQHIAYVTQFAHNKARALNQHYETTSHAYTQTLTLLFLATLLISLIVTVLVTHAITRPIRQLTHSVSRLAAKEFTTEVPGTERQDEFSSLARSIEVLREMARHTDEEFWIKSQVNHLSVALQQCRDLPAFAHQALHQLTPMMEGVLSACYLFNSKKKFLELYGRYGLDEQVKTRRTLEIGEGLVGLCAQKGEIIRIAQLPEGYLHITSTLGSSTPHTLLLAPLMFQERVLGVVELAGLKPFTPLHLTLLENVLPIIAIHLESLNRQQQTQELLEESLRQEQMLRRSQEELLAQGEELRVINEALRTNSALLEQQTMEGSIPYLSTSLKRG